MRLMTKRFTIEGKRVLSLDLFYDEIARQLGFPDYFGRNLDALYDVLSTDIQGALEVHWLDSAVSLAAMGSDFQKVREVLEIVASERDDFAVVFP